MSGGNRIIISSLPALLYFTLHNGDTSIKKIQKTYLISFLWLWWRRLLLLLLRWTFIHTRLCVSVVKSISRVVLLGVALEGTMAAIVIVYTAIFEAVTLVGYVGRPTRSIYSLADTTLSNLNGFHVGLVNSHHTSYLAS